MEYPLDISDVLRAKRDVQVLSLAIADIVGIAVDNNDDAPPEYYIRVTSSLPLQSDDSINILGTAHPVDVVFEVEHHPDIIAFEQKHTDLES
ncbi:MAG TPA: hypothetical protein VLG16_00845 [Candidatus Saccharimonadales bacterium]|nr:hypothetical protein [Candidatus Saccharimonadales bacterium]